MVQILKTCGGVKACSIPLQPFYLNRALMLSEGHLRRGNGTKYSKLAVWSLPLAIRALVCYCLDIHTTVQAQ